MKTKNFDCVEMKLLGAASVWEQTRDLTREQELVFWREKSDQLRWHQDALKASTLSIPSKITSG